MGGCFSTPAVEANSAGVPTKAPAPATNVPVSDTTRVVAPVPAPAAVPPEVVPPVEAPAVTVEVAAPAADPLPAVAQTPASDAGAPAAEAVPAPETAAPAADPVAATEPVVASDAAAEDAKRPPPARDEEDEEASASRGALSAEDDSPATDGRDPNFKAGTLQKRGEHWAPGSSNFKARWVVVKAGVLTYWQSEAERAVPGAKPIKGNRIVLAGYDVTYTNRNSIQLTPNAAAAAPAQTPRGALKPRVWEFKVLGSVPDMMAWVNAFVAQGAHLRAETAAAPSPTAAGAPTAPLEEAAATLEHAEKTEAAVTETVASTRELAEGVTSLFKAE